MGSRDTGLPGSRQHSGSLTARPPWEVSQACSVDGLNGPHGIALDARNLHQEFRTIQRIAFDTLPHTKRTLAQNLPHSRVPAR
jgi:hypothetical protein